MTLYLSNRDGVGGTSLTNEEGHYRFQTQSWTGNTVMGSGDELAVTQNSPLGMSVLIGTGDFKIDTTGYSYTGWNSASLAATISTANPSNPRKDAVVLYVDKAQNTPGTANNPGIIKHMVVAGTPAGSPVAPDDTAISTAVGASNPFIRLANVTVGTGVTQITNANISSTRVLAAPKLPSNSVTTAAIADGAVTAGKLGLVMVSAYKSGSSQSLSAGTWTLVTLNSENFDVGGNFASNKFTAPTTGYYLVSITCVIGAYGIASTAYASAAIYKNGSIFQKTMTIQGTGNANTVPRLSTTALMSLTAGDYIELYAVCSEAGRSVEVGNETSLIVVQVG